MTFDLWRNSASVNMAPPNTAIGHQCLQLLGWRDSGVLLQGVHKRSAGTPSTSMSVRRLPQQDLLGAQLGVAVAVTS